MSPSLNPINTHPGRLPAAATSFVGRERELEEAARLLGTTRLLTLTGPGGAGKTRLALELALGQAGTFADGTWWVELAPLADPALVSQAVTSALGLHEIPGSSHAEALAAHLQHRRALLVLDNCEHVIEAAAALVDLLLRECPWLKVLATSREALAVAGETAWVVPSLSLPPFDPLPPREELQQYESVRLLTERAAAAFPSFALTDRNRAAVVQICRRLDGIPLALELVAARARTLSVEEIAARLESSFGLLSTGSRTALPRHRTLRAAMDWSHELLPVPERVLLRRLAVFAGGFSLEAAERVCPGGDIATGAVVDLLSRLVSKSLIGMELRDDGARYRMLETIREYARARLDESAEAPDVRDRHAKFFAGQIREAAAAFLGPEQRVQCARLEAEHDNLRAALGWMLERDDGESALELTGGLWRFWLTVGHLSEGRRWLQRALEAPGADSSALRVRVQSGAGYIAMSQGDYAQAEALLQQAQVGARELGDRAGLAAATMNLGSVAKERGDLDRAMALYEESLALDRELGRSREVAVGLLNMGAALHLRGEPARACGLYEQSLSTFRAVGYPEGVAVALSNLGQIALLEQNHVQAQGLLREALVLLRDLGRGVHVCEAIAGLAEIALAQDDVRRAARLLGSAEALRETLGRPRPPSDAEAHARLMAAVKSRLDESEWRQAWDEGHSMTTEATIANALEESPAPFGAAHAHGDTEGTSRAVGVPVEGRAPELRVLALGVLQIYRGGRLLTTADWTYAKPRELFLYLLCHPTRTKEQIGLAFWPDASTEQLRRNLHVTLHHARRAVGRAEWIAYEQGRYGFNRTLDYEFDMERFRACLRKAGKAGTRPAAEADWSRKAAGRRLGESEANEAQAIRALEEAVLLYRGDFLEDGLAADWYIEIQDELRRLYIEALAELGRLRSAAGQHAAAADAYRRVLARDNLQEGAHRGLMLCYARSGERAQALRHYQTVVELLAAEIGSPPTPETTALWDRLRRGDDV